MKTHHYPNNRTQTGDDATVVTGRSPHQRQQPGVGGVTGVAPATRGTKRRALYNNNKNNNPVMRTTATTNGSQTDTSATTTSTRLCIKNLPLHYTEADLKRFIHEKAPGSHNNNSSSNNNNNSNHPSSVSSFAITDCRILKTKDGTSRRMAFVGLAPSSSSSSTLLSKAQSPASPAVPATTAPLIAQYVLQRLDKTYCGTAKLSVEFAVLPQSKQQQTKKNDSNTLNTLSNSTTSTTEATATTQSVTTAEATNASSKKRDFLAVMGIQETRTASSRHVWSNDDDDVNDGIINAQQNDNLRNGTHETRPTDTRVDSDHDSSNDDNDDDDDKDEESVDDADPLLCHSKQSQLSAMDFLRSKQVTAVELQESVLHHHQDTTTNENDADDIDTNTDASEETVPMKGAQQQAQQGNDSDGDDNDLETSTKKSSESSSSIPNDSCHDRLFLRNLPFTATEDDIRTHLQSYGTITECHIPVDDRYQNKGFAFVSFAKPSRAQMALDQADGRDFYGRLLHILPARQATTSNAAAGLSVGNGGTDTTSLTYKERMSQKRQQEAMTSQKGWMASFVRSDAVVDNLADRLGLRKGDILSVKDNLSSGDAAVRLALGETAVIEENRSYFAQHSIDMEALVSLGATSDATTTATERSKTAILVKNLPHDTTKDELQQIFTGNNVSILLPPSRTIAVVEYNHANEAKVAFRKQAYRRFKSVPLYLEWVPLAASTSVDTNTKRQRDDEISEPPINTAGDDRLDDELAVGPTFTVYVKNLSFSTTEDTLWDFFEKHTKDVRAVRIPQKVAALKRQGDEPQKQSMGFGFVELGSKDTVLAVLKKLQGTMLDGHALELKPSMAAGTQDAIQSTRGVASDKAPCKLMVRNVPFQATRKELLQLFGSFGSLKKVRLPKKFDGSHRGFAFIEYLTGKEASHAMNVLSRTHLYGRHLVIEWATADEEVEDLQALREKAERDITPKGKKIRFD